MSDIDEVEENSSRVGQPKERRKIEIKFIENKTRRHVTFSKRKHGIMKKAFELSVLTGTQVLLLVVSETGLVYTFSTPKFEPIVTQQEGRNLIQACLNAPDDEEEEEEEEEEENQEDPNGAAAAAAAQMAAGPHAHVANAGLPQHPHELHNNALKPEGMKMQPTAGHEAGVPGGAMPLPAQHAHHQPHPVMPHPHQQNFTNTASPYLNPEQNAVYQQYFQESQQGHY